QPERNHKKNKGRLISKKEEGRRKVFCTLNVLKERDGTNVSVTIIPVCTRKTEVFIDFDDLENKENVPPFEPLFLSMERLPVI
ncbi:unnamed protein product, partial [Hymenolepis diminuta]